MGQKSLPNIRISSGSAFEAEIGFSRAVRLGQVISVSGTAPINECGETAAPGDVYGQAMQCLKIIETAILEAGGSLSDVTRTRVMLVDASEWKAAARAHKAYFGSVRPACTFVQVAGFINPDWLIEIEADCYVAN